MNLKNTLKEILITLGIDATKNVKYDRLTRKILQTTLKTNSNCIDIGCHKGEILALMIQYAPNGKHFAFEPIPALNKKLQQKFSARANIYPYALAEKSGNSTFNWVKNAPAYSGLKKRKYDISNPEIEKIDVEIRTLDEIIPDDVKIDFIKIDVEGAELGVLKGASRVLQNQPTVLFEFGLGASDFYNTQPEDIFKLFNNHQLNIYTLDDYLHNKKPLTLQRFKDYYSNNTEYYFIASK